MVVSKFSSFRIRYNDRHGEQIAQNLEVKQQIENDSKRVQFVIRTFAEKYDEDQKNLAAAFTDAIARQHDDLESQSQVLRERNVVIEAGIKQEAIDREEQIKTAAVMLQERFDNIGATLSQLTRERESTHSQLTDKIAEAMVEIRKRIVQEEKERIAIADAHHKEFLEQQKPFYPVQERYEAEQIEEYRRLKVEIARENVEQNVK